MIKPLSASVLLLLLGSGAMADHFDDHLGDVLETVRKAPGVRKTTNLSVKELTVLPKPLHGAMSGFVIVRTGFGNWSKLMIQYARHKSENQAPADVILIDRLVTYSANVGRRVLADRRAVFLFHGFSVDLDIGQIVPEKCGADLRFAGDESGGQLITAPGVEMYLVGKPLVEPSNPPIRRQRRGPIGPADFAGTFRLEADGRWSGKLEIKADEKGDVRGEYTSDQTGQNYDIAGKIGAPANHIAFVIKFPMTEHRFDGYLWTRGKDRISGVSHMLDRPFAFHAQRID